MNRGNDAVHGADGLTKHVKSRLIAHFGLRLVLAGVFLTVCTVLIFIWMIGKIQEIEVNRDFSLAGILELGQSMKFVDGTPSFDEELLERVRSENGWLQLLDEDGNVIYSRFTPPGLPDAYRIGEITSYWQNPGKFPYPYQLYLWVTEWDGTRYTLLYGTEPEAKRVLRLLGETDTSDWEAVALPDELTDAIRRANLQVQLLDAEGREMASFNKLDASLPRKYSLSELALRSVYSERYRARLVFDYQEETQTTWVVTAPLYGSDSDPGFWKTEIGVVLAALLALLTASIVLFSALSLWYAHRFGTPVLHIIHWLQHLGDGRFHEPLNRKGRSPSHTSKGKLRRQFRLFSNVVSSLKHLTHTLRQNEEMRRQLEQTREEWIAGVSHDLKTPLSSIKGYAHMLEAEHYRWSEEEVREFSGIILQKADYMETLIEDLSLTYRLKNKALPLDLRETNVAELLRDVVKRFRQNPRFAEADLRLHVPPQPLCCRLDARWMSRAMENLLTNAFIHNPAGTKVEVSVVREEGNDRSGLTIEIRDNGRGMDAETVSQLFERYYRGSNTTDETAGSGLGMAIARQIVLAHGGDIAVESECNKGTAVYVKLFGAV
jgi:signal transduction histidine kinase